MKLLLLTTLSSLLASSSVLGQQVEVFRQRGVAKKNETSKDDQGRPTIRYGGSRSSSSWITTRGARVAVDDGIRWRGRDYYMSLTFDVAATEEGSKDAIWSTHISAFWDQMGIEDFKDQAGKLQEALALRSTRHSEFVEYRHLQTGKRLGGTEEPEPGKKLKLERQWRGAKGRSDKGLHRLVQSEKDWREIHGRLFANLEQAPPRDLDIDFTKSCLALIYAGKASNCNGFSGTLYESDKGLVLRVSAHTYQSAGETPPTWPYGVMVIPRHESKTLTVERNRQGLIGGPAMWRTWHTWKME